MGRIWQEAPGLRPQVNELVRKYHQHIAALEIRIDLIWAYEGSALHPLPTLKHEGRAVFAKTRVEDLKRRAQGHGDVLIEVDLGRWQMLDEDLRMTLLDHELEHIEPVIREGRPLFDALERPRITMRRHDVQIGMFATVAARHGQRSLETVEMLELFRGPFGAAFFPGEFGAGALHQQAVTAGRAMPAEEYLLRPRHDAAELRRCFERHHERVARDRARRDAANTPLPEEEDDGAPPPPDAPKKKSPRKRSPAIERADRGADA